MIQIILTNEELKRCHDFLEARNEVNAIAGTDKGTWQCAADDPQAQFQRQWESVWGELAFAKVAGLPMDWEIGVRKGSYDFLIKPGGRPMTIDVKLLAYIEPAPAEEGA